MFVGVQKLSPPDDPTDEAGGTRGPAGGFPVAREDFPYKVEIWDEMGTAVEQILAVSLSASIGYAAYYAATREYPGRVITLRHRNRLMSRWAGRPH